MKLLVLSELFLPTRGGTAVWAAEVYQRLGGRAIHIVTADVPGSDAVDARHPNTIHRLNLKRIAWLRPESLAMYVRFFFRSLSLALTHRFEAIHAFRALPEGLVAWAVARLTFRPVVVYAHGEELTTWGRGGKYRAMCFTLRRADRVVANSQHTRDTLLGMGVAASRIHLVYPGVDVDTFRPGLDTTGLRAALGIPADEKLVFSVGRLSRRKGFDQAVRAVTELRAEGVAVRYVIAGIGEDAAYLDALIAEHAATGYIHRIGAVEDADLPRWMNACDLFVMPNREIDGDNEGFGMVFIEAAACGVTSLAGEAGGTGSAVLHRQTGLRVDGTSLDAVVEALRELLTQDALRKRLAEAARQRVLAEFSWMRVADKTRRLHLSSPGADHA
ncbi:MAG: glycosyl transferase [Hydrogenophilales bacterium 16-64-46]|nr:MAG: glycosyl transferase [Hydrogenophilales bacterium 12-64-13]OYZ07235.1 MAG: glycosyl transferase [Hydrogenophilales bacterium 16-64-46]OZA37298.1 MAG: glycosyl transferase [Hydrogenophilales bacterium 17-64-34]HQS98951.1 glycosyltransferase family 4 protein [Thiobacillus sp.]